MGQRSPTETLFALAHAFVERPTWTQSALAKRLELRTDAVRKRLEEMVAAGFPLERQEDHPHVYWSVPKGWLPGALLLKHDEVPDLLRVLHRAPRSPARQRLLRTISERLPKSDAVDTGAVRPADVNPEEEAILATLEDGATRKVAVRVRYFTAGRGEEALRHVSVHRIELGPRARFIATCHRDGALKTFRTSNVSQAKLDPNEAFRDRSDDEVTAYQNASVDGFHGEGAPVRCAFVVRKPDAAWAANNLPSGAWSTEPTATGTRFTIETPSLVVVARFVVGFGDAAIVETKELARAVATLARGALHASGADRVAKSAVDPTTPERPISVA